jgi:hypothetical protein
MFRNSNRSLLVAIALIGSLAFACIDKANAQTATRVTPCNVATPNNALCVSWQAVTTDTNGNAITGVTYRVDRKLGSGTYSTAQASGTATQYYATNLAVGTHFFVVYANCAACTSASSASNEASAAATAIPVIPNSPVIIIAATIRSGQPPTFRIVYTVTPRADEYVFVAPASTRPVFAAR